MAGSAAEIYQTPPWAREIRATLGDRPGQPAAVASAR
jgi:hypothetical protein